MRILITGVSGLLGINLAMELAQRHLVYGTVNQHKIDPTAVPFEVLQVDLLQSGAVEQTLEASRPDWVIHCAALANLDACERDPELAVKMNTELPEQLAFYVARGGARFLHISTDSVFDGSRGAYTEEDTPNPLGVYSRTKLSAEQAVAKANPHAVIARVNLFGWGITGKRSLAEFFFNGLREGKPVNGFTDVFFNPILANDMAAVMVAIFENRLVGLYHLVGRTAISKYAFGVAIAKQFGFDENMIRQASVHSAGLTAARAPNLSLQTEKLANAVGMPMPDYSSGLEKFYELYRQGYPQWLQKLGST